MSKITRNDIKAFLVEKAGYLKKSPLSVAKALWKNLPKTSLPKTHDELNKELTMIKDIQVDLRTASSLVVSKEQEDIMDLYNEILKAKNRPKKRLFFDIEVSPNIVLSWRIGNKVNLSHDDIVQERAIICVCYKWEGEDEVHSLKWDSGDDKNLLLKFSKIMDSADEVVTQNGDSFDIKWVRTRCFFYGIPLSTKFNSIDTLKMARTGFRFNSNKLDYMTKFIGLGGKIKTEYDLWKDILLKNSPSAMKTMIDYCKQDVVLLEEFYQKIQEFSPVKKFRYKF